MRNAILTLFTHTLDQCRTLVADVPDDRFAEMPHANAKHPGWVLGHLACASGYAAAILKGEEHMEGVPEAWAASCMSAGPTASRGAYGSKDELLSHLERTHALAAERFLAAPERALAEPFPKEEYRPFWPTVGDSMAYLLAHHEGYHLGQLSMWRHEVGLGTPGK